MVQSPDGAWHQLRESEVIDLVPDGRAAPETVMLSRLDRTSGVLRLAVSNDCRDAPNMKSTIRNFAKIEFRTGDIPSNRDFFVHLPRNRPALMRYALRTENSGVGPAVIKGHKIRYGAAEIEAILEPAYERGFEDSSLEDASMDSTATTNGSVDTITGFIDGWPDFIELSFGSGGVHTGTFFVGWS